MGVDRSSGFSGVAFAFGGGESLEVGEFAGIADDPDFEFAAEDALDGAEAGVVAPVATSLAAADEATADEAEF